MRAQHSEDLGILEMVDERIAYYQTVKIRNAVILAAAIATLALIFFYYRHQKGSTRASKSPQEHFMADFMTPISFYGKVIDQFGEPVPNATVTASANDNPFGGKGTKRILQSDPSGFFAVEGMHGLALSIEVSKQGYYRVKPTLEKPGSYGGGLYVTYGNEAIYHLDKDKPTIFTLHKQGEIEPLEPVRAFKSRVPPDWQPILANITPEGSNVRREIKIRMWIDEKTKVGTGAFDWGFELEPINGGILPRDGDFEFTAPEAGYQVSESVMMLANLPRSIWNDNVVRWFFLRFNDGVFARIRVTAAGFSGGGISITGFLNPRTGSRNLETDPGKR